MNYIVMIFGAATIVAGIIIVINPESVFGLMRRKLESLILHILAVVVRIILGVALIRKLCLLFASNLYRQLIAVCPGATTAQFNDQ